MTALVIADHGVPKTTSVLVAGKFKKRHTEVLRAIRNLECSPEFNLRNFASIDYVDGKGRKQPSFSMTRDGFVFLAMGFTGREASGWKEQYIDEFNRMESELRRMSQLRSDPEWTQVRTSGKSVRHELTDVIADFKEYAIAQGSQSPDQYYNLVTKMENKALFLIDKAGNGVRDKLTVRQLSCLSACETIAAKALRDGMAQKLHYKQVFLLAKERVIAYVKLLGPTLPGDDRPMLLT